MSTPEAAASANPTPGELFVAQLPALEERIDALVPTANADIWQPTARDGVIGIAHALGTVGNESGVVTISRWYGRGPEDEAVAGYGVRPFNDSPFVIWQQGVDTPEDVRFKRHTSGVVLRPNFPRALLLADLVMVAEPLDEIPISTVSVTAKLLRGLGSALAKGIDLLGEIDGGNRPGKWPYHP